MLQLTYQQAQPGRVHATELYKSIQCWEGTRTRWACKNKLIQRQKQRQKRRETVWNSVDCNTHLSSIRAWASTYESAALDLMILLEKDTDTISASAVISWMFINNKPDKLHPILIPQQQPSILLPSVHHQYVGREKHHIHYQAGSKKEFSKHTPNSNQKAKSLLWTRDVREVMARTHSTENASLSTSARREHISAKDQPDSFEQHWVRICVGFFPIDDAWKLL
jgi:hypothetical protein